MIFDGLDPGAYKGLVVDPPWPYAVRDRTKAEARRCYSLMSFDDLAALPVADLAHPDGAVLFLWATNRFMATGEAGALARAWGFTPVTVITWVKTGQPGVGWWARGSTEHLILATRGKPGLPEAPLPSTIVEAPRAYVDRHHAHSRKPAVFGDIVEQLTPGPYVELFARQARLGWSFWGSAAGEAA